jgi:CheY-like chemotaxis protein
MFPDPAVSETRTEGLLQKRILVVEDSALVAMDVIETLQELGCEAVGPAGSVQQAFELMNLGSVDGAILDVNLGAEDVFPVADLLASSDVPFMFATGYDRSAILPARFQRAPTIQKPFEPALLKATALKTFS